MGRNENLPFQPSAGPSAAEAGQSPPAAAAATTAQVPAAAAAASETPAADVAESADDGEHEEEEAEAAGEREGGEVDDVALAMRLQAEEERDLFRRMMEMAGYGDGGEMAELEDDEVDPDNMTYEVRGHLVAFLAASWRDHHQLFFWFGTFTPLLNANCAIK